MHRSHPSSGRPATPADINRNARPTSSEYAATAMERPGIGRITHDFVKWELKII
jgi:hypothetical protein